MSNTESITSYTQNVIKRDGAIQSFDTEKIIQAIYKAMLSVDINVIKSEHPEWFDKDYENTIVESCKEAFESEKKVVDWILEMGEIDFIPKNVVLEFIKNRFNNSLASIGISNVVSQGSVRRNTTLLAVAPTTSSAFILGQVSQSIEPLWSNCYVKDIDKMKITIKNPLLEKLLEEKGLNTREIWQGIRENDGSVQHLSEITDKEKEVFKTFAEIDQKVVIEQAAERQKYIDQGQSLNLMIDPSTPAKEVNALYLHAWKRGIKTFYYQHSMNAAQQFGRKKLKEVNLKQKEVDQDEPKNVCISCEA